MRETHADPAPAYLPAGDKERDIGIRAFFPRTDGGESTFSHRENEVPEAGYWLCRQRHGIVPATLAPLLEKRNQYKRLKAEYEAQAISCPDGVSLSGSSFTPAERARLYDARQKAIKWILVTCFGYLGYRNARFGRIEAHEAVTAFGREKLLQAKEIAEAQGWRVLHGLTDCLYLAAPTAEPAKAREASRDGAPRAPLSATHLPELCEAITRATGVEMAMEGVYRWICFLPSRIRPNVSVPNRFWGVFTDGKVKVRGLMLRKHDTPELIREAQTKALEYLAQFETLEEARAQRATVEALFDAYAEQIRSGRVSREALTFKRRLTRSLNAYRAKTPVSVSLWKLHAAGIRLEAGQCLRYLIVDAHAPNPEERYLPLELCTDDTPYDIPKYLELLEDARAEILFYAPSPEKVPLRGRPSISLMLPFQTGGPSR
ncbi:MAG: DNA polymerase domain-containing protein [bacterium JZ-2024 1]